MQPNGAEGRTMTAMSLGTGLARGSIPISGARFIDTELSSNEVRCSVLANSGPPLFVEPTGGPISTDRLRFVDRTRFSADPAAVG